MFIKLNGNNDKSVEIDDDDYEIVKDYKWYYSNGYATTTFHRIGCSKTDKNRNVNIRMHQLIMGEPPQEGLILDHKDRNRINNKRSNLRWVTYQQNLFNSSPAKNSKLGLKGITREGNKYGVNIKVDGIGYHLGAYSTKKEAAMVYDKAARFHRGEYAYLNFPDEFYDGLVKSVDYEYIKVKRKSQYKGVSHFDHGGKRVKRWRAVYCKKTLGYFHTEFEAHTAYEKARNNDES